MTEEEVRALLIATGEEVRDEEGRVIGYIAQPAKFKVNRPYLARGGFLVVTRDEETGAFIGTEFDALPHPRAGQPYPAGHSERAFEAATLEEAVARVMEYLSET